MKKILVLSVLLLCVLPVLADDFDINLTPRNTFSGYPNSSMKTEYPHLNTSTYQYTTTLEQQRKQWMKPTSVKSMGYTAPQSLENLPVSVNQFPQSFDSSDMMHVQQMQQGMQNMYMGL